MVLCTYIGNTRLRAFPMYYYPGFSRRYIGIKISMPIPMYGGPNLSTIYIGMGQYRLLPMYRHKLPKQNTSEFRVFIQSRCISINFPRIYLLSLATYSRANQPHFNFPRIYLLSLAVYSRASGVHYDLRGDSLGALSMWQRGLLNLIDFEGWIHRDCLILWSSDVFFFWIHRNMISLMHPDVSEISLFATYIGIA